MLNIQNVSWDDLRLLLAIAREGSLRRAATKLNLAPSTLSRRIASLEEQIGGTLIARTGDGVDLTAAGAHAHAIAADMEQRFIKVAKIAEAVQAQRGVVRCAVTEGIGTYWIMPHIGQFQESNPNTMVKMTCTMSSTDVMRLEADLAIEYTKPAHPELICVKLATIHVCLFASKNYLARAGTPRRVADLEDHALVDQASEQTPAGLLADLLGFSSLQDRIAFVTNTSSAHYQAIDCGLGIGLLPTYATPLGADVEFLDLGVHCSSDLWLTYHPDLRDNPKIMAFVAWLRRIFDPVAYPCFAEHYLSPKQLAEMDTGITPSPVNAVTHAGRFVRNVT